MDFKNLNIRELRKKASLTQMQLAAKLGVSMMSIRIWENGAGKPNAENYKKLVKLFNLYKLFEVQPL
jgi:DNA-binding XRE family transcriptional regulator